MLENISERGIEGLELLSSKFELLKRRKKRELEEVNVQKLGE